MYIIKPLSIQQDEENVAWFVLDIQTRKYARQTKNYTFRNIVKEENHNFRIYLHLLSVISLTAHVLFGHLVVYRLSECVYITQVRER